MRYIDAQVTGQFVSLSDKNAGVQGECGAASVRFAFDESWGGYAVRVVWRNSREENPVAVNLTLDSQRRGTCLIPGEPLALAGECSFTAEGLSDGFIAKTVYKKMTVTASPGYAPPSYGESSGGSLNVIQDPGSVSVPPDLLEKVEEFNEWKRTVQDTGIDTGTFNIPNIITYNLYSEHGAVANLVVNRLRTDLEKPFKCHFGDTTDVYYHVIDGVDDQWIQAVVKTPLKKIPWLNIDKEPVYWYRGEKGGKFTTSRSEGKKPGDPDSAAVAVEVYDYDEHIKQKNGFYPTPEGYQAPQMIFGEGNQAGNSIGTIMKESDGLKINFKKTDGTSEFIRLGDDGITSNLPIFLPKTTGAAPGMVLTLQEGGTVAWSESKGGSGGGGSGGVTFPEGSIVLPAVTSGVVYPSIEFELETTAKWFALWYMASVGYMFHQGTVGDVMREEGMGTAANGGNATEWRFKGYAHKLSSPSYYPWSNKITLSTGAEWGYQNGWMKVDAYNLRTEKNGVWTLLANSAPLTFFMNNAGIITTYTYAPNVTTVAQASGILASHTHKRVFGG